MRARGCSPTAPPHTLSCSPPPTPSPHPSALTLSLPHLLLLPLFVVIPEESLASAGCRLCRQQEPASPWGRGCYGAWTC